MTLTDEELRSAVRSRLPEHVFAREPWRLMYAGVLILIIIACGWGAMQTPWYIALPLAVLAGNCYAAFMFFGHEVAHGAVIRSRRVQELILYLCCAPYCLSPKLWRVWHNGVHHGHANVPDRDPDHFGTLERYQTLGRWRRFVTSLAPGSGNPLSIFFPFLFFTAQCQGVLWIDSKDNSDYASLRRWRAKLDSFAMLSGWVLLGILTGWPGALFVVIIPMLTANFVLMSYIVTNHLLRPLGEKPSSIDGTMGVTTLGILDLVHFNFSHHIEHHLFPATSSRHYPKIRAILRELAGDRYIAPAHWWALYVLYRTPRVYDGYTELVEPVSGRRVTLATVEEMLELH